MKRTTGKLWLLLRSATNYRGGWAALALVILLSLLFRLPPGGAVAPAHGDVPAYLAGAYHISADHIYAVDGAPGPATPALGREPLYPLFLAGILQADPNFHKFTLACLTRNDACPASIFAVPRIANLILILLTGICLFIAGRKLTASPAGGVLAAAYILFNTHMNKVWGDLMSDWLALFLVAAALLAFLWAKQTGAAWRFAILATILAALTLTKAIFLPFCLAAIIIATLTQLGPNRRQAGAILAASLLYIAIVGGWAARNYTVSGMFRLTDSRSGIALSTRAVFDDMTPRQYAAAFVFWSGPTGSRLARHWFGHETADAFDLTQPGGYYERGQLGYGIRVQQAMARDHIDTWQATAQIDHEIIASIAAHPIAYALTMFPLTYRGLGIDEFLIVGFPCFLYAFWHAVRRRDWVLVTLLSAGAYNMLAYAAFSLNIQRYQITAMPEVALAFAVVCAGRRKPEKQGLLF